MICQNIIRRLRELNFNEVNCKTINSTILIKNVKNYLNYINGNKNIPIICKYLSYFSVFDILTNCAFPNKIGQCKKYKNFINHYSSWKYKSYISYLQLECILKDIKNKELKNQIEAKIDISRLKTYNIFRYEPKMPVDKVDFTEEKLKEDLSSSQLRLYEKYKGKIRKARYDNLFYKFRCFVVHELRFPNPPNVSDIDVNSEEPLYFSYTGILNEGKEAEKIKLESSCRLYFSPKLILLILKECIEKSKKEINYDDNYYKLFEATPKCWI